MRKELERAYANVKAYQKNLEYVDENWYTIQETIEKAKNECMRVGHTRYQNIGADGRFLIDVYMDYRRIPDLLRLFCGQFGSIGHRWATGEDTRVFDFKVPISLWVYPDSDSCRRVAVGTEQTTLYKVVCD